MKYVCVDTVEFLYPDVHEYQSGTDRINILSPRGSYACAQVFFYEGSGNVAITCEGWNPEIYEMVAIPVEYNALITEENKAPYTPVREAPFYVYDCLKPFDGEAAFKDGVCGIYFSMWIPEDAPTGIIEASVQVRDVKIPVTVEVSSAVVPKESLTVLMGYDQAKVCQYHKVEKGSQKFEELDTEYLSLCRRGRQNALYAPSVIGVAVGNDQYEFDFSELEAFMGKAIPFGYKLFTSAIAGKESHWKPELYVGGEELHLHATSMEAYCYLAQYMTSLADFLEERGWSDNYAVSIVDEPEKSHYLEYRVLFGIIKKFAPKIKVLEASSYGELHGAMDIYVPLSAEYEEHKDAFDTYKKYGDEVWYYDCLAPRGSGYINRYMDNTLLSTRYHGWANYAYNLTGYLHWAVNRYQPGQDPFTQSCPQHINIDDTTPALPAGDTHIIYPGDSGPWMSVRLENQRAGAEEYEMLRALEKTDKKLADFLCDSVFHSFKNVEYNPINFRNTRNALIRAMENKNG